MAADELHNESELLNAMAEGNESAFDTLYWHYSPLLYRNLIRLLKSEDHAEELLQEIFIRVWEKRSQIVVQTTLGNYLFAISRNLVADMFRKIKKDRELYQQVIATATEDFYSIDNNQGQTEKLALLNKAIESLPNTRAKVFRLVKIEGKSYEEVSQILGISTSTISDHIVKATRFIRTYIADNNHIAEAVVLASLLFKIY